MSEAFQQWFYHVTPYVNAHRGKTLVLCVPGEALEKLHDNTIISDIALLRSLGIRLVVVFGCDLQLELVLGAGGHDSVSAQERLIADAKVLQSYAQVVGMLYSQLNACFSMGMENSPFHGAMIEVVSGNWVTAKPYGVHEGIDYQFSGTVRKVDHVAMERHLQENRILIVPPLGYSPIGERYVLQYDDLAAQIACALQADKLIYLSSFERFLDAQGKAFREIQLPLTVKIEAKTRDMKRLFDLSKQACMAGVSRVHWVGYQRSGNLLQELFTREGSGTLISAQCFERVRTAQSEDIAAILKLIEPLEVLGVLVSRSRILLEQDIEKFSVIERDGSLIGCVALYLYLEEEMAEIACVVVEPEYQRQKKGEMLVRHIEQKAKSLSVKNLFVLTTQSSHWFQELGYTLKDVHCLPKARRETYNRARNSKILFKNIE